MMNKNVLFLALAATLSGPIFAQAPLKIIVPFAAGGGGDLLARMLVTRLGQELGRPIVVENRVGAGGQLGMQFVKSAPPDESVVILASDQATIVVPLTTDKVVYDTRKDFVGLGRVATFPYALAVAPALGKESLNTLMDRFKKDPAQANVGLPSIGGIPELVTTAMGKKVGTAITTIPYNGAAPTIPPLLGGQLSAAVIGFNNVFPLHKEGKVKVLAVTGSNRSRLGPEIPTFEEAGIEGLKLVSNWTFYAPAKTPQPFVQRFNQVLNKVLAEPDMVHKINAIYMDVAPISVDETTKELAASTAEWSQILKAQGTLKR